MLNALSARITHISQRPAVSSAWAARRSRLPVKLDTSKLEEKPDTLVVNGSECEPYLTSDHRIMVENAAQIVDGILLAMKATGVSCAKVGIEDNKPDAVQAMRDAASGKQGIEVVSLPARYPQGFEKTLIYSLTGRIVPNGKLPSAAKCVVINVGTCAALSAAVRKGQPLIDRVVTVTGRVAKPTNFRVRIGTPLLDLIDQAGGLTEGVRKLVVGGAMMGNAVPTLNLPITKNFGGFLALGEEAISAEESACIRCGRCMRACPMKLAPAKIDSLVRHGDYDGRDCRGSHELHGVRQLHICLPGKASADAELPCGKGDCPLETQKVLMYTEER